MKLYEFTFTDNQNLPESEVLALTRLAMVTEAATQGWAPDYAIAQCKPFEQLPSGERRYFFAVQGKWASNPGTEDSPTPQTTSDPFGVAAQSPGAEI